MARHKPSGKKKHLSHALKQAQPVPSWVVAKTSGKVRRTPKQRNWRKTKIKVQTLTSKEKKPKKKAKPSSKEEKAKTPKKKEDSLVEKPEEISTAKEEIEGRPEEITEEAEKDVEAPVSPEAPAEPEEPEEDELEIVEEKFYDLNLRRIWNAPREKRTPRAVRFLREFVAQRMKTTEVLLSEETNSMLWQRGISKPPRKIRVRVVKDKDGRVIVFPGEGKSRASDTV